MNKVIFPFTLAFFAFALFCALPAAARQLTPTERKSYAQNNIIFYVPCDTLEDCESGTTDDDYPDYPTDPTDPSTPDIPSDPTTPISGGAQLIVDTAIKMSWPNTSGQCRSSSGGYINWSAKNNPASCSTTLTDYAKQVTGKRDGPDLQDCGKFVSQVIRHTVDSGFPTSGVKNMIPYMQSSSKWQQVRPDKSQLSLSDLQPGDILAFSKSGGNAREGHIMVYLGKTSVKCGSSTCTVYMAEASYTSSTPRLTTRTSLISPSTKLPYLAFRYKGN